MKSLNIFGKEAKVIVDPACPNEVFGYFEPQTFKIVLHPRLQGDEKTQVLIHEMIHATMFRTSFFTTSLSLDMQELICDQIATALVENFKLTPRKKAIK